jgi:hypothetical protein
MGFNLYPPIARLKDASLLDETLLVLGSSRSICIWGSTRQGVALSMVGCDR